MLTALRRRGLKAEGISNLKIFHLVGRETGREGPGDNVKSFCLRFSELSPYAVMEILDLTPAQQERFYKAYDATRAVLKDLKVFPSSKDEESILLELDELETGYPKLTLSYLLDVAGIIRHKVAKEAADPQPFNQLFRDNLKKVQQRTNQIETSHEPSWLALIGRLGRINRLKIFDNPKAPAITYSELLKPGQVSVIDLSDTDSPQVRNLVIADILRGVQRAQEAHVAQAAADGKKQPPW